MEAPTDNIIAEMCREIIQAQSPDCILLVGSCAQGNAQSGSDVDLLVVTREGFRPGQTRRQVTASIRRALSRFRVPKDILVYSRDEIEEWRDCKNHIIYTGLTEGRVLYERPEAR
jgi:predicted nucleotidyltransferase